MDTKKTTKKRYIVLLLLAVLLITTNVALSLRSSSMRYELDRLESEYQELNRKYQTLKTELDEYENTMGQMKSEE